MSDVAPAAKFGGPLKNRRFEGNILWGKGAAGDLPNDSYRRADPKLARDDSGMYRPQSSSAVIDAAVGSHNDIAVDVDGMARTGVKDVGADEFSTSKVKKRPLTPADVGPAGR